MSATERALTHSLTRRTFMGRMTQAGLGVAAFGCLASSRTSAQDVRNGLVVPDEKDLPGIPGTTQDMAVLNYALTLEILEADLYRQALNHVTGRPADARLEMNASGYRPKIEAGLDAPAAEAGFAYLVNFAAVEAAHRDFLLAAVHSNHATPVKPNPGGYRFPNGPGNTLKEVLANLLMIEETGVRAYLGASTLIDNFSILTTAASIYSTECSHSSAIRVAIGMSPGPVKMPHDQQAFPAQFSEGELEYYLDPRQVLDAVKPFMVS